MDRLVLGAQRLGLAFGEEQQRLFEIYYEELTAWNRRVNLTGIVDYEEVQVRHFLDSLTVALALDEATLAGEGERPRLIDVGSGAGLPGVPLKILFPFLSLTLLESAGKKVAFLRHLVSRLGLGDVEVVAGRAEELGHQAGYREAFHVAVSRAVAPLPTLAELCLPFCRLGGILVAQKKFPVAEELAGAARAIALVGGAWRETKAVAVEGLLEERALVIIAKERPTPPQYPRRPGLPAKRPL